MHTDVWVLADVSVGKKVNFSEKIFVPTKWMIHSLTAMILTGSEKTFDTTNRKKIWIRCSPKPYKSGTNLTS